MHLEIGEVAPGYGEEELKKLYAQIGLVSNEGYVLTPQGKARIFVSVARAWAATRELSRHVYNQGCSECPLMDSVCQLDERDEDICIFAIAEYFDERATSRSEKREKEIRTQMALQEAREEKLAKQRAAAAKRRAKKKPKRRAKK